MGRSGVDLTIILKAPLALICTPPACPQAAPPPCQPPPLLPPHTLTVVPPLCRSPTHTSPLTRASSSCIRASAAVLQLPGGSSATRLRPPGALKPRVGGEGRKREIGAGSEPWNSLPSPSSRLPGTQPPAPHASITLLPLQPTLPTPPFQQVPLDLNRTYLPAGAAASPLQPLRPVCWAG